MIQPSDLDLVDLVAAFYAPPPGRFTAQIQVNPAAPFIGVVQLPGYDVVIARGSVTAEDWERDVASETGHVVKGYEALGLLPSGFSLHLTDSYAAVKKTLRPGMPAAFAGHSLGAPEVAYLAAAHILAGGIFARLALFEPPHPGTATLASFFARDDISAWWNEGDPVPHLPVPIAPFLPWQPVRLARRFNVAPPASDKSLLPRHSIALCQTAVRQAAAG